jgi:hypothetical protein
MFGCTSGRRCGVAVLTRRGIADAAGNSSSKCRLFWVRGVCRCGLKPYTVETRWKRGRFRRESGESDVACAMPLAATAFPRRRRVARRSTNSPRDCSHPRLDEGPRRRRRPAQASRVPRAHPRSQARATARLAARRRRTDLGQARTQAYLIRLRRDPSRHTTILPLHSLATLTGIPTIAPGQCKPSLLSMIVTRHRAAS